MSMRECHVADPRYAGLVTRYHTWTRIREQSVAEHSWQVARILLAVWPKAPRHLVIHALVHDLGEQGTGDLPWPVKARNAVVKAEIDELEAAHHLSMCHPWGLPPTLMLAPEEKATFKLAEEIEMCEWAWSEMNLGNQRASLVLRRIEPLVVSRLAELQGYGGDWVDVAKRGVAYWDKRRRTEMEVAAP